MFVFVGIFFVFPIKRRSFSICGRTSFVVWNSPRFCLSVKLLIFPSHLNEILAGYSNLGCRFFSFITETEEFLLKDQLLSLWESPCVLLVAFPLLLLIFALCLTFINLINMCLGVFRLGFILFGILWVS